jgi:hypothetical protein
MHDPRIGDSTSPQAGTLLAGNETPGSILHRVRMAAAWKTCMRHVS